MNPIANLTIKLKLVLFALLGLGLVGLIILVNVFFGFRVETAQTTQVGIYEVLQHVQQARIAEKAYLQFYMDSHRQSLVQAVAEALRDLGEDEGAAQIKTGLQEYETVFAQVVELHGVNARLTEELTALLDEQQKQIQSIIDLVQQKEFQLQMEGESLDDNSRNLMNLTRDAKFVALSLSEAQKGFLLSGDEKYVTGFQNYLKNIGLGYVAALEQFSVSSGNQEYVRISKGVRSALAQGLEMLLKSRDLFLQENAKVARLDEIGAGLVKTGEKVLADTTASRSSAKTTANWAVLLITLVGSSIFIALSLLMVRGIISPLQKAMELAGAVRDGDLSHRLNLAASDEIGRLCGALDQMADSLEGRAAMADSISHGDLGQEVKLLSDKDVLGKSLHSMVESLNDLIGEIHLAGEQIAEGSGQVSDSSQVLSDGASRQASSLEEITSTMNELASKTRTNAENASQANVISDQAQQAAQKGNERMREMVGAMSEIRAAGQNISRIIKVIDEIAFQTNLLALNAAVEAARAGQHGKGFAVVAEEVRNLAARSAKAASETAELIESSVKKAEGGAHIADRTAEALGEIVAGINKVSGLVSGIAKSSSQQAQDISIVTEGLSQIDKVTQQNTATVISSAAAAEELSSQAMQLKNMISRFRLKGMESSGYGASAMAWSPSDEAREEPRAIALDDNEFGKF